MNSMKSLCVFCGSSFGNDPSFLDAAKELGRALAYEKITLVYGGANVGLMGSIADATLESGGRVIGVLPKFLQEKELAHKGLTDLVLCDSMHERKTKMYEISESFLALPGGFGTLEELSEVLTWQQLGLHRRPIGVLNVNGYYDHLESMFNVMLENQLLKAETRNMAIFDTSIPGLLAKMRSYVAPIVPKWIHKAST
jgi:uncharacterized protein (TIGR00730 family)